MYNVPPDFDIFSVFFPYIERQRKILYIVFISFDKQLPLRSINHPLGHVQNRNSLKLGQNYAYRNPKLLQMLGDFVPQTSTGASPLDPTGGLLSPDPLHRTSPTFCTRFMPPAHYNIQHITLMMYSSQKVGLQTNRRMQNTNIEKVQNTCSIITYYPLS